MPRCSTLLALATVTVSSALWAAPYAYVANSSSDTVSVIDTASDAVIKTIPVGSGPWGVAVGPGGERVYVTNHYDNTLSVIDGVTQSVIKTVATGAGPLGLAVSDDGRHVLVANGQASSVTLIDAESLSVVGTQAISLMPSLVAFAGEGGGFVPGKGHFLVAGQGDKIIEVGRNLAIGPTHTHGSLPGGIVTQGSNVHVSDWNLGWVSRIYTDETGWYAPDTYKFNGIGAGLTYTVNRSVPSSPFGMLLVVSPNTDTLWMISTRVSPLQALAAITVGDMPMDVAVTPAGDKAYVVNHAGDSVSVIDIYSQQVIEVIPVGSRPSAMGQFIRPAADYVPDAFAFKPVTNAAPGTLLLRNIVTSGSVAPTGFDRPTPVAISCPPGDGVCGFSIDGAAWTRGSATMSPGSSVRVRVAASAQAGATTRATLSVGGREAEFAVTTQYKRSLAGG